jgi:hypothetical protein
MHGVNALIQLRRLKRIEQAPKPPERKRSLIITLIISMPALTSLPPQSHGRHLVLPCCFYWSPVLQPLKDSSLPRGHD